MLVIPFLQTEALRGAVPELLELTWGQVQGLGFTLEAPQARTLLPLAWEVPAGQWRQTVSPRTWQDLDPGQQ